MFAGLNYKIVPSLIDFQIKSRSFWRLFSFLLLLFSSCSIFFPVREKSIPTLKAIQYERSNIIGIGFVQDGKFVENKGLTFLRFPYWTDFYSYNINRKDSLFYLQNTSISDKVIQFSDLDTIISGEYFKKNDTAYIKGVYHSKNYYNEVIHGTFQVSNVVSGFDLTINSEKAYRTIGSESALKVEVKDIYSYYAIDNYDKKELSLNQSNDAYYLIIKYADRELETDIQSDDILKVRYCVYDNLNESSPKVKILDNNGNPLTDVISEDSLKVRYSVFNNLIESSQKVKLHYNNGNSFEGIVKKKGKIFVPFIGKFIFSSGDEFAGEILESNGGKNNLIYYNDRIFVPYKGETKFSDGVIMSGDWLAQYKFTEEEWLNLYNLSNNLTEIRDNAATLYLNKQRELQKTKSNSAQKKKENQLLQQEKKNNIVSKYGEYFGNLINRGELGLGMDQAMVNEVWNKEFFDISKSQNKNRTIEVWEYNEEKMQSAILDASSKNQGDKDSALSAILLINLSKQMGGPTIPKMLVFKNNKLTDIIQ